LRLAGYDGAAGDDTADALDSAGASHDAASRSGAIDHPVAHLGNAADLLDLRTAGRRRLCDLHAAGTNQRTAASAGAQFCQGHPNRHINSPCSRANQRARNHHSVFYHPQNNHEARTCKHTTDSFGTFESWSEACDGCNGFNHADLTKTLAG
jgi:hypothetical protein